MKDLFQKFTVTALSATLVTGCAQPKSALPQDYKPSSIVRASLVPPPLNPESELALLSRYRGQTKFANLQYYQYAGGEEQQQQDQQQKQESGGSQEERPEQESDIYKIGKPGSKLLYLLNYQRGLQVVSFEDGIDKPKIVGRVRSSGNYPDEMYFDASSDRLIVIERVYKAGSWRASGQLVVYDVRDAHNPKALDTIQLPGDVADSRIVGNILYVATSLYDGQTSSGEVLSYSLSGGIKQIDSRKLKLAVSDSKNMNIVSIKKDDGYHYYLIATLSKTGWGWFDREAMIEVIDISSEKGAIKPLMTVAAKGFLRERSQTLIKNDTLIVTSNYVLKDSNNVARIAVETFKFPTEQSEFISEDEATYRRLHIERALKGKSGKDYEDTLQKMMNDPELGLKGRFVQNGDETRKIMPDSSVTVGDGSGLSANLQDVRYDGDKLYAFWVPANSIDPFDLFDISKPEEGVKYISRLQFDGWISRAIPFTVQGRSFILGLGWVVPVVDNENGHRAPQAMMFEVMNFGGKLRPVDVAQYTFEGSNIYTDFNGQDKMVEVRMSGEGQGEVMFSAYRWSENSSDSGAQLLSFDIQKVIANQNEGTFSKGVFLTTGKSDWLRRAFTNPEIERINTFSDEALATFSSPTKDGTAKAINILELARNIQAYDTVAATGIQFISPNWYDAENQTELRAIANSRADSELPQATSSVKVDGAYVDHLVDGSSIYVLTSKYENVKSKNGQYEYRATAYLSKVDLKAGALTKVAQNSWTVDRQTELLYMKKGVRDSARFSQSEGIVKLANGEILAQVNGVIKRVTDKSKVSVADLKLVNCKTEKADEKTVIALNGQLLLRTTEAVGSKQFKETVLLFPYVAKLNLQGGTATCAERVNIPGDIKMLTPSGEVLVEDTWVKDIEQQKHTEKQDGGDDYTWYETKVVSENSLLSFKLGASSATLVDESKNSSQGSPGVFALNDHEVVHIVQPQYQRPQLEFVSLDKNANIEVSNIGYETEMNEGTALISLVAHPSKPETFIGLTQNSDQVQALEFSMSQRRPSVIPLKFVAEDFTVEAAKEKVRISLGYYGGYAKGGVHFSPDQMSFEIPSGMAGINQVLLAE